MAITHPEVHVLPAAMAQLTALNISVDLPYEFGGVLLAAHGAMEITPQGDTMGWGHL